MAEFRRRPDGGFEMRDASGAFQPVEDRTDMSRLKALTEEEIEEMAATDPDHPALDDEFWAQYDAAQKAKKVISIKLDGDIVAFFRKQGRGYQTRINAVLRHHVDARTKMG